MADKKKAGVNIAIIIPKGNGESDQTPGMPGLSPAERRANAASTDRLPDPVVAAPRYKKGGQVKARGCGCAVKGKTKGRMV